MRARCWRRAPRHRFWWRARNDSTRQRTRVLAAVAVQVGQALEPLQVAQIQAAVLDAMQFAARQFAQGLVGVHQGQGQAQAVGDVLLGKWKRHALRSAVGLPCGSAFKQHDQQPGDAFLRSAPPNQQQAVVYRRLFMRRQPGNVETHRRQTANGNLYFVGKYGRNFAGLFVASGRRL